MMIFSTQRNQDIMRSFQLAHQAKMVKYTNLKFMKRISILFCFVFIYLVLCRFILPSIAFGFVC